MSSKNVGAFFLLVLLLCIVKGTPGISAEFNFNGITVANGCSGFILRFDTSLQTDSAMVLTNGHCSPGGYIEPNIVNHNISSTQSFKLRSEDGNRILGTLRSQGIMYSTMTSTDIALFKLELTYEELERRFKVKALTLSRERPEEKSEIVVVSGLYPPGISGKIYSCSIDGFVHQLKEGPWIFDDAIRYSECATKGGTSGAPVLAKTSGLVIGIHSTRNEQGELCAVGSPCEVDIDGRIKSALGAAYAQQTYQIYTCINSDNQIDLSIPGCKLPK